VKKDDHLLVRSEFSARIQSEYFLKVRPEPGPPNPASKDWPNLKLCPACRASQSSPHLRSTRETTIGETRRCN